MHKMCRLKPRVCKLCIHGAISGITYEICLHLQGYTITAHHCKAKPPQGYTVISLPLQLQAYKVALSPSLQGNTTTVARSYCIIAQGVLDSGKLIVPTRFRSSSRCYYGSDTKKQPQPVESCNPMS
ncbi:hypothetical protein VNO78_17948 [Psophocarpus tetragonolobus]|uniref:Uncharacterized protein n=1 Tax=Psophocarpus tetragonolobus TaxID=3891 RepID=A0AAN9SHL0_PSOTE